MDSAEFEKFLVQHEKDLFSFCRYLCGESAGNAAADLYQDTALAAFEMRSRLDFSRNPKALLFSVAVGKWKNFRRKSRRRQAKVPEVEAAAWEEPQANAMDGPEAQAQSAFQREAIRTALAGLKDKFRIPLILHYFEDLQLEAIAEICGIPKGTVKSRLHKGRALLKAALEKEGFS